MAIIKMSQNPFHIKVSKHSDGNGKKTLFSSYTLPCCMGEVTIALTGVHGITPFAKTDSTLNDADIVIGEKDAGTNGTSTFFPITCPFCSEKHHLKLSGQKLVKSPVWDIPE